jgi:hypothetical protein
MKQTALLLSLLFAMPLIAAEERWRMSALGMLHGGGVALSYAPRPGWDVEAAVSAQRYEYSYVTFNANGLPPVTTFTHHITNPVDLFVTRHLATDRRIVPFVHAGVRYTDGDLRARTDFSGGGGLPATRLVFVGRASAQAGGGMRVRLTPRTALRMEVTRLLRSNDSYYDPLTRAAAGLSWHF